MIMRYTHETGSASMRPSPLHYHYSYRARTPGPKKATMHARASGIKESQEIEMILIDAWQGSAGDGEGSSYRVARVLIAARTWGGKTYACSITFPSLGRAHPPGAAPVPGLGTLPYGSLRSPRSDPSPFFASLEVVIQSSPWRRIGRERAATAA